MAGDEELTGCALKVAIALADEGLIPRGRVACYESVGVRLGLGAWTTGQACKRLGRARDPSEVPYHRIIHKDGKLPKRFTGHGGVSRHRALLREEGHVIEKLKVRCRVDGFEDHLLARPRRSDRRRKK